MSLRIHFEGSFPRYDQLPPPSLPEIAFWGRSNVGKSSLINMLTGRKGLARTSARPGRTQAFNLFRVDEQWRIVDLPGLGYARVAQALRRRWLRDIHYYVRRRPALRGVIYLIDLRIPPQPNDLATVADLLQAAPALLIGATKADKLSNNQRARHLNLFRRALREHLPVVPQVVVTSAVKRLGKTEIWEWIHERLHDAPLLREV